MRHGRVITVAAQTRVEPACDFIGIISVAVRGSENPPDYEDDVHVGNLWVESLRYLKVTVRGGRERASDWARTMAFHCAASGTKPFDQPEPQ